MSEKIKATTPEGFEDANWKDICGEATALLQQLLRIDTTNPPGDEIKAARALGKSLEDDGIEVELIESAPGRGNLICRLEGQGANREPPLLLMGHLDVVPAGDLSLWTHPPFSGELADGMIWGRGAVDMKNMVAMSAMMMKVLARREVPLRRDVILAAVADEEAGCRFGSRFLVEEHPDKVRAGFALGEVGGFPVSVGTAKLCLVQTAEKGMCWLRVRAKGQSGHGSMPTADNAVVRLCKALGRIGTHRLPQHNTPVVESFIRTVAGLLPPPNRWVLPRILTKQISPLILDKVITDQGQARNFNALLHNTACPTVLRAGQATNVIPDVAEAKLDGRLLPGQTAQDLIAELKDVAGDEGLTFEVITEAEATVNHPPDSPLWDCITQAVSRADSTLNVVPYMIPGFTDAKYFSQLGARCYGFSPVYMDPFSDLKFSELFHGIDERIPEDGYHWGLGVLWEVVESFCKARG